MRVLKHTGEARLLLALIFSLCIACCSALRDRGRGLGLGGGRETVTIDQPSCSMFFTLLSFPLIASPLLFSSLVSTPCRLL